MISKNGSPDITTINRYGVRNPAISCTQEELSMRIDFICPSCKTALNSGGPKNTELSCGACLKGYASYNGCYDFTESNNEQLYYQHQYPLHNAPRLEKLNFSELKETWFNPSDPERTIFYNYLPELKNKTLLLLGNGLSTKELFFLKHGARLIYSDISINAVINMKCRFDYEEFKSSITFHAIDAYSIPLNKESIDIIIGYALVHHLEHLDTFLKEVYRVLKPNGMCLFFDNAYSPVWQKLKFSILRPLTIYSHKQWGMSPEDVRATKKGGFKREELDKSGERHGFEGVIFDRFGFLYQLFKRGKLKLLRNNWCIDVLSTWLIPVLFAIDKYLSARWTYYYGNTMNVVWGFEK